MGYCGDGFIRWIKLAADCGDFSCYCSH